MRARKVTVPWTEPESELEFSVHCTVSPGYPGDREEPASGPDVDLDSVTDERGQDRPDVLALLNSDFREDIEALAATEAAEADLSAYEDAQERGYRLRSVLSDITGIPRRA